MAIITISRLLGSDGDEIAMEVAEGLGYDLVESGLILRVAERAGVSVDEVKNYDEQYHSRAVEWLKSFITPRIGKIILEKEEHLDPETYIEYCKTVVRGLAEKGNMVIVGRGSQFILKDFENAFHVRIIADDVFRTERIRISRNISTENAREIIKKSDYMRGHFIERYFKENWNDSRAYHLTLDSSRLGIDVSASIIMDAARQFSRTHEYIPGVKDRRIKDRRLSDRRKGDRREPASIWSVRNMENAILHDGRPIRSLNKEDRRKKEHRMKERREQ
ncbi:MAG: cytidylate kinase-like family protein [Candidatus Latescibacteria bacterium]|nr:cytidylate kinase-like family protein [Candidatus Latescibacterota bacterium]